MQKLLKSMINGVNEVIFNNYTNACSGEVNICDSAVKFKS